MTTTIQNEREADLAPASVTAELECLKKDIAQLTADMQNVGSAIVDKGREFATAGYEETTERLNSTVESCCRTIEERPMTSVVVALGAGVLLGKLMLGGRD
ncbi:MAG: hypothetical protein HKO59_14505 [Phycisphaerales bacterium]|nr:hypothetical protein [Phycisphaerales bacterium]NNM27172.1 hypothetical protein [Phycisphaerales bacterium]